jgi:uncharacterized protein
MATETRIQLQSEVRTGAALGGNSGGEEMTLIGRAIQYGTLSAPLPSKSGGQFRERCAPGCFKRSLADTSNTVLANYNHDEAALPLGSTESGTLKLQDKPDGLYFRIQLDPTIQAHRELHTSVKRGDVSKCSWEFVPDEDGEIWDEAKDEDGNRFHRRTLTSCKLFGVSVVNRPAYTGSATNVIARSAAQAIALNEVAVLRARAAKQRADIDLQERTANYADAIRRDYITDPSCRAVKLVHTVDGDRFVRDFEREREIKALETRYGASGAGPGDAGFSRMEGDGQTQDPTQSLRCGAASCSSTREEHEHAIKVHRQRAHKCTDLESHSYEMHRINLHSSVVAATNDDERAAAIVRCVAACGGK